MKNRFRPVLHECERRDVPAMIDPGVYQPGTFEGIGLDPSLGRVEVTYGDFLGRGRPDQAVYVGWSPGFGPRAVVTDESAEVIAKGLTLAESVLFSFYVETPSFMGGQRAATVYRPGPDWFVTANGPGGGPWLRYWDLSSGTPVQVGVEPAFDVNFRGGISQLSSHDFDGDGFWEVTCTAGEGGGPVLAWFSPETGEEVGRLFMGPEDDFSGLYKWDESSWGVRLDGHTLESQGAMFYRPDQWPGSIRFIDFATGEVWDPANVYPGFDGVGAFTPETTA